MYISKVKYDLLNWGRQKRQRFIWRPLTKKLTSQGLFHLLHGYKNTANDPSSAPNPNRFCDDRLIFVYNVWHFSFQPNKHQINSEYWKGIAKFGFFENLRLRQAIVFASCGFINSQFYRECMGSLVLLPPRNLKEI